MKLFTFILSAAAMCVALVSAAEEEPALRGSAASAVSGVPAGSIIPKHYPIFKQCDARWGKDYIYTQTVCDVGCLMSSTSMALNGHDIKVAGNAANPGVLNTWLKNHHGYEGNIMIESAVHVRGDSAVKEAKQAAAVAASSLDHSHAPFTCYPPPTERRPQACIMAC